MTLCALLLLPATVLAAPAPLPKPLAPKKDEGRTVVLGTWAWAVAGNKLGGLEGADLFWQQVSDTERNLVPLGGAGWALLEGKPFEKVALKDLKKASYSTGKLFGSSLRPGTIVALRTRDGHFAKLKVVGYRALHDTSFPEAKHLPPGWVQFVRSRPNVKEYHLEVDWALFR
jgi:hypothetical protein